MNELDSPPSPRPLRHIPAWLSVLCATAALVACGGDGGSATATPAPAPAPSPAPAPAPTPAPTPTPAPVASYPLAQRAGALAQVWGKPKRLMIGLGTTDLANIRAQGIQIDIKDHYLTNISTYGHYSWDR
ncbi:MAG: hypothetical protein ACOVO0_07325, partial [Burkholderiaceae bacterium]